ncbi:MAG: hypothetical protein EZS26_000698 [Candidatus Ordinivivax streblomastigis]|uniref:Fibronectin type-III domain-containing protein n=1 Tax=Candidatus Ordinivivax streblomastigis TaxID=2540710 RepID=A0A5M8P3N8_9BACT|nr:MAG: hypothetical protein EZS26_000698 [Candidatus Ordinivivax streblomastigis]
MKRIVGKFNFILFALVAWSMTMVSCGGSEDLPDSGGKTEEKPITLSTPSGLSYERRTEGFLLFWNSVDKAESYEVSFVGIKDTVSTRSWCTITDVLEDSTKYTWKVRAVKGDVYSDWAISSLTTPPAPPAPPVPVSMKYVGVWETDSTKIDVDMAGIPLPVADFLPDTSQANGLEIVVVKNDGVENGVLLSVPELNDYIPVGSEGFSEIPMTYDLNLQTIRGSVEVNKDIEQVLDPPLLLEELDGYDDIIKNLPSVPGLDIPALLAGTEINSVTIHINTVSIEGKLENEAADKATFIIIAEGTVQVATNNPVVDNLLPLLGNGFTVTLEVFSTKVTSPK